jgi:hypothetical protein
MRLFLATLAVTFMLALPGCGNLSPRQEQEIDNQDGRIGEIENLANSNKLELGTLQSQSEITDSELDKIQQGMLNLQNTNENSGVQILSGPGGIAIAVITVCGLILLTSTVHFRGEAKKYEKTADMFAQRIVSWDDPALEDEVFQAAMYTDVEDKVLDLIKRHKT